MRPIRLAIEKESKTSLARAGVLSTPHGDIKTPAFVAVGTKADVKGIDSTQFPELGVQTIIANTYHLFLSPGEKLIEKAGGIHKFMGFAGPIMTDSGGFQVFSLGEGYGKKVSKVGQEKKLVRQNGLAEQSEETRGPFDREVSSPAEIPSPVFYDQELATSHGKLAIVDEDGVSFTSHIDGSFHRFTPERSIEIQHGLGADIIYAFDECTSPTADYNYQREAMDRTHRWADRSLKAHRGNIKKNNEQGLYGIVQGGRFADLRLESAKFLAGKDFDGYGIGGSFSKEDILGILDKVSNELPKDKPRHLLGIGEPEDILIGVAAGMDTFDCVVPTRNGRTGGIYTKNGKIQIPNAEYKEDFTPLDAGCDCTVCANHTRSYIHHLFRTHEMLGPILASQHNIRFLTRLVEDIRQSVLEDRFEAFRDAFLLRYRKS